MPKRTLFPILLLLLGAVGLPTLFAYLSAGNSYVFAGFLFNPNDGNSYLAKMLQGWSGSWRFVLPYTAEAGQGAYLFLFYLFLGHLARWLYLPILLVFHLTRLISSALLVAALTMFFKRLFGDQERPAFLALIWAVFGSGLGWLALLWGGFASDMWVAEAYPFLSSYANPHFPLGLALLLFGLEILFRPFNWKNGFTLAGIGILLSIILPFGMVVAGVLCAGMLVWNWQETKTLDLRRYIAFLTVGGLFLLYQYLATLKDPVLAGWDAQNITTSPHLWDFVLSFSPALLLALFGLQEIWRRRAQPVYRLLLVWLGAGLLLVYLPFHLQRRFLLGYFIPVTAAGVVGLFALARRYPMLRRWSMVFVLLSVVTNLGVLAAGFYGMQRHDPALYLARSEDEALIWITDHVKTHALILADPEMGLFIPARTGRRVIYGHPFETVQAVKNKADLEAFYSGTWTDDQALEYLQTQKIDYVLVSDLRQTLDRARILQNLTLVFQREGVHLYRVQ